MKNYDHLDILLRQRVMVVNYSYAIPLFYFIIILQYIICIKNHKTYNSGNIGKCE